ncbi:PAS domain S-box protein [Archangium violaceum]|uniref:PAS domain S-box protein n=1 Tax=Archangium violaceum TaxID=83451 RepID=UPI00193C017F|nr:PAS domain S-box protein [Archangium violaceum]QRK06168.1 PAS domain S-box protein [Archangium violaceum]
MANAQPGTDSTAARPGELLHNLPGAIVWESDAAAIHFSFVSESAASMLGFPAGQWQADEGFLKKHVHPEDWGRVLETLYEAAAEGSVQTCEHRMFRSDGSTLWVQTSVQRSSRSNGSLLLTGLTVDITRSREAEYAHRDAEAHSQLLLENIRDYGVFMLSLDGCVASWSPGAQRLKGFRADEVIGVSFAHFFPADEFEKGTPQRLLVQAEMERKAEYEGWLLRKGGGRFWGNLILSAVTDERGRLRGFSNVARDLTARKRAEQALRESEEHFRLLVESQDYGVFMVSPEGRVETWNRGAQRLEGYRAHEIIGSPMSELFPRNEVEEGHSERLLRKASREGKADYEGWLVRKGGERFWGLLTVSAVEDEGGHLRGFSVLARDVTSRRQTEEELRRSEEYFRLLVGSVQDYGVFMLSLDGAIESWNQGAQRLKGYRAHEVVGSGISRFFPPEELEKGTPERLFQDALLKGIATYEGWLVRKDGDRFWAIVTLSAVEDENGRLRGVTNVAKDLTERKRVEDALRESEEQLRLLIDSVQGYGVFMVSPDGQVASWSPGAERVQGYRVEEVMGAPLSRFFRPEEVANGTPERLIQGALAEGRAEYEGWLVRKGGTTFWASVVLGAVMDRHGNLRGFSNITRDLTERMRAERAISFLADVGSVLAGSLDYRTTLEKIVRLAMRDETHACIVEMLEGQRIQPVAVAHVDQDQERIIQKAVRIMPVESRMGQGVARVVHTGQPELKSGISDVGWLGEALGFAEPNVLRDLGVRSYMCVPLTARGKTFGAMVFLAAPGRNYASDDLLLAEELARRAALALDNARLYEQAQIAIRMREEVLAIVSHDLRSPLSMIQMGADQLLSESRGREQPEFTSRTAAKIRRASVRMIHLIRDLLDFSSIEAGQLRIEVSNHDAGELVTELLEELQPNAGEKGIRLERETEPSSLIVRCDRERIVQVFSNLLGNAIKFTGEGGSVMIRTRREGDQAVFSVSDTGPGIPEEDLSHIFDRYWQVNRGTRESFGLGLAISKAIIESHGGKLGVESRVGQGTTFFFTLPLGT